MGLGVGKSLAKWFLVVKVGFVPAGERVGDTYIYVKKKNWQWVGDACCFFVFDDDWKNNQPIENIPNWHSRYLKRIL